MGSTANVNTSYLKITPMRVTYKGVDLGSTMGGVKVTKKEKYADLKVDQWGDTIADSVVSGIEYKISFVLAEYAFKDNWKVAMPFAKLVTSGPNKIVYSDISSIGSKLSDAAGELILHPLDKINSDKSEDFKYFKVGFQSAVELEFGPDKQVGLSVEGVILPDTLASPARFFVFGDPVIGLVAATLTQSGYTGTGNGLLSGISAGSSAVTETITATCVTAAANGGIFHVSGSVSGSLGLVSVGVPFVNSKGNFTINDGATDFVVGDAFTLASVAANYA